MNTENIPEPEEQIRAVYQKIREKVLSRIEDFRNVWREGQEEDIFAELVFCILTPSSRARSAWSALEALKHNNLILYGAFEQVSPYLNTVRFKNKKALFIIRARKLFLVNDRISIREKILQFPSVYDKRDWLVSNVDGIGYKEASHFLRNIGFTDEITILDRHILKNLSLYGVIEEVPGSLSKKRYLDIEKSMIRFSEMLNIPVSHLDFILWFKETGDVFK